VSKYLLQNPQHPTHFVEKINIFDNNFFNQKTMKRRNAVRNMALGIGGLMSLPAWATGWHQNAMPNTLSFLSGSQETLLAEVVETIIPATNTPGAKALGVHQFVQKVVADCYDKNAQNDFSKGLDALETTSKAKYNKAFAECDTPQRIDLLKNADAKLMGIAKWLTIKGYTSSEYVMTKLTHFEFAPARYKGCVPVK
jgi:hypothetical protein